jgi:hypothetical protein
MVLKIITPEEEQLQLWLDSDTIYQGELIRINNIDALNITERSLLIESTRQQSLQRRQQHLDEELHHQQDHLPDILTNDSIFQADLERIRNYKDLDDSDRQELYDSKVKEAMNRINKEKKKALEVLKLQDTISPEVFLQTFKDSVPNKSNDPKLMDSFVEYFNRPIQTPNVSKSSLTTKHSFSPTKQVLKKLHRNNEPENVLKPSGNNDIESDTQLHHHHNHKRMSNFALKEFYHLVRTLHQDIFFDIMTQMALTDSILEPRSNDNDEDDLSDHSDDTITRRRKRHKHDDKMVNFMDADNQSNIEQEENDSKTSKTVKAKKDVPRTRSKKDKKNDEEKKDRENKDDTNHSNVEDS